MSKVGAWFESWDIFGHPIVMNYRGKKTYQTKVGALCTFMVYALSLFNLSMLVIAFKENTRMETAVQKKTFEPFNEPAFSLAEHRTTIAMQQITELPANIGRFRLF